MTHLPGEEKNQRTFVYNLSYVLLLIILAFVISNVTVIQSCKNRYLLGQDGSMCSAAEVFAPLRQVIPIIYRPAEYLEARGDQTRANLVVAAYSFTWGSFLVFSALMIAAAAARVRLLSDQDRREFVNWSTQHDTFSRSDKKHIENLELGRKMLLATIVFVFVSAYWGFFSYDTPTYLSNMVQERDRDLYYPMILLFFIQTTLIMPIASQIKKHLSEEKVSQSP